MNKILRFQSVSKRYNLGLTRTSLPSIISGWFGQVTGKVSERTPDQKHLWALQDVSFEMEEGESLALIGANGAGKTTVLKLLAKITRPTHGSIEINGMLSALIELGAGFHADLTGRENIFLNGSILGMKRKEIEGRFDEIVSFSELERFIDTPVKRYSSGMAVRLGFAVAACMEPEILLVDEVLAVGDASFRQKCLERIQELLLQGTSIVFVSHNLWLVQAVCAKALYLDRGRFVAMGKTPDVIALYDRDIHEQRAAKLEREAREHTTVGGDSVEITQVEVVHPQGVVGDFRNDQSARVDVHYLAYRHLDPANVVLRVIRSDGLTCCMMRSSLDDLHLSLSPGAGTISVTLDPLQLYGGSYYVQAIVRDASDSYPLADHSSEWFFVEGSLLSHQEMNGVFEPRRTWSHNIGSGTLLEDRTGVEDGDNRDGDTAVGLYLG